MVLVDESDNQIGTLEKLRAHSSGGSLHRAFSVFVFDRAGRTLLQRRATTKYHSPGLWSNTCCSHPRPGEDTLAAAHRRLREELGFDCPLQKAFTFIYKAPVGNNLTEWEYDYVYLGEYDGEVKPNPAEVDSVRWVSLEELASDTRLNPSNYTEWLKISLDKVARAKPKSGSARRS